MKQYRFQIVVNSHTMDDGEAEDFLDEIKEELSTHLLEEDESIVLAIVERTDRLRPQDREQLQKFFEQSVEDSQESS